MHLAKLNFVSVPHKIRTIKFSQSQEKPTISHTIFSILEKWYRACIDIDAQTTAIDYQHAKAYYHLTQTDFKLTKSGNTYEFGDNQLSSLGALENKIPVLDQMVLREKVDVVQTNVPFLIGLELLEKHELYFNNVKNVLCGTTLSIGIPLKGKRGHVYLKWDKGYEILNTRLGLVKGHKNFSHPASHKLFNLLKLARPLETNSETRRILEEIQSMCDTCERIFYAQSD